MEKVTKLVGAYDEKIYWERVSRSLAWLGETEEEQKAAQEMLSNATVGVAGSGGIGGALVMRLARLGVRHIKVADPDKFDFSNLNRQYGSSKDTIGQNKATVVGNEVFKLIGDVTVEIFSEGITVDNAEEFVSGCDLVFDQMDFYLIKQRYALHRAFRAHEKTKCILSAWCIGWGTSMFKWTRDGMPIWEYFGLDADAEFSPEVVKTLLHKFMPQAPRFPDVEVLHQWLIERKTVPLFAGTPPVAEAFAATRGALILTELEREPLTTVLPAAPDVYVYDASILEGKMMRYVGGKHVDEQRIEQPQI